MKLQHRRGQFNSKIKNSIKRYHKALVRQVLCWCNINYDLLNSHIMPGSLYKLTYILSFISPSESAEQARHSHFTGS